MASTFRRREGKGSSSSSVSSPLLSLPGTKPWTGGVTLTSVGLRDLDNLLGSGQPLGTCLWLEEDRWTHSLGLALVKYWCAEALSQQQLLLIPVAEQTQERSGWDAASSWDDDEHHDKGLDLFDGNSLEEIQRLLHSLPRNLHLDKTQQTDGTNDANSASLDTLLENDNDNEDDGDEDNDNNDTKPPTDNEEGLKIAWQYRTSVQRERLGQGGKPTTSLKKSPGATEFCHSYDLQGKLSEQLNVEEHTTVLSYSCESSDSSACGIQLYKETRTKIDSLLLSKPKRLIRILFYHVRLSTLAVALPLLLSHIREHQWPVVILTSVRPWICPPRLRCHLRRLSDIVLETEGFASRRDYPPPPEFRRFHGLLKIPKVSTLTAATAHGGGGHFADVTSSRHPTADLYGLKRDRRKLHIQMLHIPPEDYAEGGGSVGSGAVRSGAGRPSQTSSTSLGCASSGGALDF